MMKKNSRGLEEAGMCNLTLHMIGELYLDFSREEGLSQF